MSSSKKAFDAKRNNTFSFDPDELIIVGGDGAGDHPVPDESTDPLIAECYDPDVHLELEPGFAANIDTFGVVQPITIVKIAGQPYVVDGRTRVRGARVAKAAQLARGEQTTVMVECKVMTASREGRLLAVMVTLNEARRSTSVLSKIAKMERLRDRGATDEDLEVAFQVSAKTVKDWTAIAGASTVVKKAVESGKVTASDAVRVAKIEGVEMQRAAIEEIATLRGGGRGAAGSAARRVVAKATGESTNGTEGVELTKRQLRKVLDLAKGTENEDPDPYWDGVHDALGLLFGLRPYKDAKKVKKALKHAGAEPA